MEVFTHHQHSLSQDSASASEALMMMQPPPPTLSRLPPDGHEFPPDYRDPTSNTFQVSTYYVSFRGTVRYKHWQILGV